MEEMFGVGEGGGKGVKKGNMSKGPNIKTSIGNTGNLKLFRKIWELGAYPERIKDFEETQ